MANYSSPLDATFQALADPTRRQVVERLSQGPASVSALAAPFEMALPSFMQHLKVLEQSGLVTSYKQGRVRTYQLEPGRLQQAVHWLSAQNKLWDKRLDQLDSFLHKLAQAEHNQGEKP